MQIQRIQSVWLLIAFAAALTSWFFPWLHFETASIDLFPWTNVFLMILAGFATLLPLLAIFMYRTLRRQKLTCALAAFMAVFSLGYVVALSWLGADPDGSVCLTAPMLMACSGLFDVLARNAIRSDENLLKSADRIR